ncbi:MAG: DUF2442 domain-containing protein [Sedimentisphaerales bacterium]|nr:DUF2442 domain-containing protein [Sedimentisphaerales bacterium]
MNILVHEPLASRLTFEADDICVELKDGRKLIVPLAYFPRLLKATDKQRQDYIISGGGSGLHWEKIDEDICVKSLMMGIYDRTNGNNS